MRRSAALLLLSLSASSGFGVQPAPTTRGAAPLFLSSRCSSAPSSERRTCLHHQDDMVTAAAPLFASFASAVKTAVSTGRMALTVALVAASVFVAAAPTVVLAADDMGASSAANSKLTTGGASTLQSGRTISITRGVNLDNSNFRGQNLKGVAFQQSIVRDADFRDTNLVGASFFDATLDGSNFENSDMTLTNVEMAQFNRANLKNAVMKEVYVSGSTLFEGIKSIENTDWTDTYLRADQKKYLCNHPTAKGTNPKTGVDTRESLMCLD